MAILEKIRSRSLFLILVIGLALFAFVISGIFTGDNATGQSVVGEVNGEPISREDFALKVESMSRRFGPNASTTQIVNQVWNQEVRNTLLKQQFEELGIRIEKDQILNVVKANPAFLQDPNFQNEAGLFDEGKFIQFIAQLKATSPEAYAQWQLQEDALINASMEQSYFNLIKAGVGATLSDGELAYHLENDKVSVKYVKVPYSSVADSLIQVTDKDIEAYVNENKEAFTEDASRDIRYVIFEEKPSDEDMETITSEMDALLESSVVYNESTKSNDTVPGFGQAPDPVAFVNEFSDVPFSDTYVVKSGLPSAHADSLFNLSVGEVYGPYRDGEQFKVSRLVDRKSNASVKASHILIAYDEAQAQPKESRTKEEAKAKAESLLAQLKADPSKFEDLAKENSEDPGSASRGGSYDNISEGQMVPEFNDYIFSKPVGELGIVETDFGYHIIKVDAQYEGVKLATVVRNVEPSERTINDLFAETTRFEMAASEGDFAEVAETSSYNVRPATRLKAMDEMVPGLGNQRGIVQWAFNPDTKVGAVKRFNVPNGYAVVQLTAKRKEGLLRANDAMARALPVVRNRKKAAYIKEKSGDVSTLDAFAQANDVTPMTANDLSMKNPVITGAGREPKVVGVAFGLGEGEKSGLIEGESGVYMVEVVSKSIAPSLDNYATQANAQKTLNRGRSMSAAFEALKAKAEIVDDRSVIY